MKRLIVGLVLVVAAAVLGAWLWPPRVSHDWFRHQAPNPSKATSTDALSES